MFAQSLTCVELQAPWKLASKPVHFCRTWWLAGTQRRQDSQTQQQTSRSADATCRSLSMKRDFCRKLFWSFESLFFWKFCASAVPVRAQPQPSRRPSCGLLLLELALLQILADLPGSYHWHVAGAGVSRSFNGFSWIILWMIPLNVLSWTCNGMKLQLWQVSLAA